MLELTGKRKIILAISGTLLLGVVSNGLWELLIKPSITWLRDVVLNIASLGIESIKNGCYVEIAKGFREAPSLDTLILMVVLLLTMNSLSVVLTYLIYLHNKNREHRISFLDNVKESWIILTQICAASLLATILLVILTKHSYVNSAISHYKQVHTISRPFMSEEKSILLDSQFSRIAKKDDYVAVLSQLYEICEKNKIPHTKFRAW